MKHKQDFFVVMTGRLIAALIALASVRAVTTFLSPDQYGELALLVTIQSLCGLFLISPVGQYINLHTHEWWDDGSLMMRLRSYRWYVMLISVIGALIVVCVADNQTLGGVFFVAISMLIIVVAGTWNTTLIPILNMLGFRIASAGWSMATGICSLLASIVVVWLLPSAAGWFLGQAIGLSVGVLGAKYVLKNKTTPIHPIAKKLPILSLSTIYTYCIPLACATGMMWLQLSGYRFVVENFWGLKQLGLMVIGFQIAGQITSQVESLASQFIYPMFYRQISSCKNKSEIDTTFSDLLNTLIPVYFILAGVITLLAPYLLKVLVSAEYQDSVNFVVLGAGIEMCRVMTSLLSNASHVVRKTKALIFPYMAGGFFSLLGIYVAGILQSSLEWSALGLILGAFVMLFAMYMRMRQLVKFYIDWIRFYAALFAMIIMLLLSMKLPIFVGMIPITIFVMAVGGFFLLIISFLFWRNPSSIRLFKVSLEGRHKT